MAFPTAVNDQITDAVSQANTSVLGDAPTLALGALYQAAAQAHGLAVQNAIANQQAMQAIASAALTVAVNRLLGEPSSKK